MQERKGPAQLHGGGRAGTFRTVWKMSFVLRLCFWFGLVLLLIPFGSNGTNDGGNTVSPLQAAHAAGEAVGDALGLCNRKPDVCKTAKEAAHTIAVRARAAARMAVDYMNGQTDRTATGSIGQAGDKAARAPGNVAEDKN